MALDRNSEDYKILLKTIYAEARGEAEEGQRAVAWVIKNRADLNREYWGGNTIAGVCKKQGQFECWKGRDDIGIHEMASYRAIDKWLPQVYVQKPDPTNGCDHYNNPTKEGDPDWTKNCSLKEKIGNHQFYKGQ
jgi:N-acetylmuramoyl-L-alanine amidase